MDRESNLERLLIDLLFGCENNSFGKLSEFASFNKHDVAALISIGYISLHFRCVLRLRQLSIKRKQRATIRCNR